MWPTFVRRNPPSDLSMQSNNSCGQVDWRHLRRNITKNIQWSAKYWDEKILNIFIRGVIMKCLT